MAYLIDSNVILDIFENDDTWADWSVETLEKCRQLSVLYINPIIYSEISIGFQTIEELEKTITRIGFKILLLTKESLFLSGKVFFQYKKNKGMKSAILPDFYIGAHAAVSGLTLVTRDKRHYRTNFPGLKLITPDY